MDQPASDPTAWTPPDQPTPTPQGQEPTPWTLPAPRPWQPGAPPYPGPAAPYRTPAPPYGYAVPAYGGYPYGYGMPEKRRWTAEPPAGTPYHRMARNGWHRWWRPIVGTLLVTAGVFGLVIVGGVIGYLVYALGHDGRLPIAKNGQIFPDSTAELAFELATLAILTPVAFLGAWLVQRRRPGTLSSVKGRLRWGWLGVCCLLAIGFLIVSYGWGLAVEAMFSGQHVDVLPAWKGWHQFIAPAVVIVLLVPFQATAEEYLFRGWLIQAIGSWAPEGWMRTRAGRWVALWPALAISAVVFMLGHGYTGWARLDIFLFGLLAGWLAVRTGGLEAGIALHTFNNLYAFLIPAAAGQLVDAMDQGGSPWWALLSDLVPLVLYAAAVLGIARHRHLESRSV